MEDYGREEAVEDRSGSSSGSGSGKSDVEVLRGHSSFDEWKIGGIRWSKGLIMMQFQSWL